MNEICPSDLYVDEVNNYLYSKTDTGYIQKTLDLTNNLSLIEKKDYTAKTFTETFIQLNQYSFHFSGMALEIKKNGNPIGGCKVENGICFILKKDNGYIIYYVNEKGIPGAIDTEGKIYSNKESIDYLRVYDPEKFAHSSKRAVELGLKAKFDLCEVLVWGDTYYSTEKMILKYWRQYRDEYLYINANDTIQYDLQGNGYQTGIYTDSEYSKIVIVSPEGKRLIPPIMIHEYSSILKKTLETNSYGISTSWYVGFGGNIYYYIAGEDYTEVFRIRRTWGNPDFYAMAINGYTEDEYGKYVDEVLPKMSKADLRLLRNTIFALYGVHFKSEDLSKYFDKQVWYTDEGKTSGQVVLPEHRQQLVEMIQKLEK
ncbi:MAG: YARHG domain-containing protein [Treponema sp.]|nr:YARHG domain-containing protein [Treponema sp.]